MPSNPPRIVVVDDEEDILILLSSVLESAIPGAEVRGYLHPSVLLDDLPKDPADVMLTDFRLPVMDGIELIGRVRAAWPDTRFILMTAYADSSIEERAIAEPGVTRFINKIAEPKTFVTAVSDALQMMPGTEATD